MINIKHIAFVLTLLVILGSSCKSTGKLTRRYYSVVDKTLSEAEFKKEVAVNGFVQPEPIVVPGRFVPKTIFDLSPVGQKALIEAISRMESKTTSEKLIEQLRLPLSVAPETKSSRIIDMTRFTKIITLSSKKLSTSDADRISSLDIALTSSNSDLVFTGCDKIVTSYMTADLGKLTLTKTLSGEVGYSLGLNRTGTTATQLINGSTLNTGDGTSSTNVYNGSNGLTSGNSLTDGTNTSSNGTTSGSSNSTTNTSSTTNANSVSNSNTSGTTGQTAFTAGLNAKLSGSRSFYEEVGLRQRYITLSAYIADKKMHFYQEGIAGIDVSGNVVASVSMEFRGNITDLTAVEFSNLFTAGTATAASKIKTNHVQYSFPAFTEPVTLTISYEGIVRKVTDGHRTISEADDDIEREKGKVDNGEKLVLIPKEEFTPMLWYICLGSNSGRCAETLEINGPVNSPELINGPLYFSSYENGLEFLQWLKKSYNDISAAGFKIGDPAKQYTLKASSGNLTLTKIQQMRLQIFGR